MNLSRVIVGHATETTPFINHHNPEKRGKDKSEEGKDGRYITISWNQMRAKKAILIYACIVVTVLFVLLRALNVCKDCVWIELVSIKEHKVGYCTLRNSNLISSSLWSAIRFRDPNLKVQPTCSTW